MSVSCGVRGGGWQQGYPCLAPEGLGSMDDHQALPDWRPWFLTQLPKPPGLAPGGCTSALALGTQQVPNQQKSTPY